MTQDFGNTWQDFDDTTFYYYSTILDLDIFRQFVTVVEKKLLTWGNILIIKQKILLLT